MFFSSKYQTEEEAENAYFMSWRGKLETLFAKREEISAKINHIRWTVYGRIDQAVRRFTNNPLPTDIPF